MALKGEGYGVTKAFSYLAKVSNEKKLQIKELLKIAASLKKREGFLDVGAGAGDLFYPLARKFRENIAVEPADRMFGILASRTNKNSNRIKLLKITWQDFSKKYYLTYRNYFDMIICVHTMYFIGGHISTIRRMLRLLRPGGKLVLINVLHKNPPKEFIPKIRYEFLGIPYARREIYDIVRRAFPRCKMKIIEAKVRLKNISELERNHLSTRTAPTNYYLRFAVKKWFDEFNSAEREKLRRFMAQYETKDSSYLIKQKQWICTITRP